MIAALLLLAVMVTVAVIATLGVVFWGVLISKDDGFLDDEG